jgi:F-type H+-transporting ATPase subunit delta
MDHNIAEAVVTSAVALSDEQMAALKSKLEKISGKTVALVQKRDPAVLAGLRVELEGRQLDGTVQSRLSGISRKINEVVM